MTGHAQTDRWYGCGSSFGHISMAESTVQPYVLDVGSMGECDRLFGAFVETEDV